MDSRRYLETRFSVTDRPHIMDQTFESYYNLTLDSGVDDQCDPTQLPHHSIYDNGDPFSSLTWDSYALTLMSSSLTSPLSAEQQWILNDPETSTEAPQASFVTDNFDDNDGGPFTNDISNLTLHPPDLDVGPLGTRMAYDMQYPHNGYSTSSEYLQTPPSMLIGCFPDMSNGSTSDQTFSTHPDFENGYFRNESMSSLFPSSSQSPLSSSTDESNFDQYVIDIPSTADSASFPSICMEKKGTSKKHDARGKIFNPSEHCQILM